MNVEAQTPSEMELGLIRYEDEDELFLKRLSVYATVRPDNLKRDISSSKCDAHKSLAELFQVWNIREQTESDNDEDVPENDLADQLELREHELSVKGRYITNLLYNSKYTYLHENIAFKINSKKDNCKYEHIKEKFRISLKFN